MNNPDTLVIAVERMRRLQKAYFKNRSRQHLTLAKDAEREVDQMILQYRMKDQLSLFNPPKRK